MCCFATGLGVAGPESLPTSLLATDPAQLMAVILIVIKFGQRQGVFIKARWAALARPVELLARAEAPAWARELELAQGLGLPCTPKKSQAGRS
jgi:hypothetical protein